jgi:hypothetical protein
MSQYTQKACKFQHFPQNYFEPWHGMGEGGKGRSLGEGAF